MSNIPIEFEPAEIVRNDTFHLSYVFDVIHSIETSLGTLPIQQEYMINALQINLSGKTSNPNISLSLDGVTKLFTLNTAYITDTYPHIKDSKKEASFVIEGYSIQNLTKERILLFLPMTKTTKTNNVFYPLEQSIINKTPIKGLTFDDYIKKDDIITDFYTYYNYKDNDGTLYHIIYFNNSTIKYTTSLKIPKNDAPYNSKNKIANYKTTSLPKRHDKMDSKYEDNIYIDCVPVEIENQKVAKYMKVSEKIGSYYAEFFIYIVYVVILVLVVYGIYKLLNQVYSVKTPISLK